MRRFVAHKVMIKRSRGMKKQINGKNIFKTFDFFVKFLYNIKTLFGIGVSSV